MKKKAILKMAAFAMAGILGVASPFGTYAGVPAAGAVTAYAAMEGDWRYEETGEGGVAIMGYHGNDTELVIPEEIAGKAVTEVGDWVFADRSELKSIVIPQSLKRIGSYAFDGCSSLEIIEIPEGVESIGEGAFGRCASLQSVTIPESVIEMGGYVFSLCTRLKEINVAENNENYKSVDGVLFRKDGTQLLCYPVGNVRTKYEVPAGVECIGAYAFAESGSLTEVTIPESVLFVDECAFTACSRLTEIKVAANNKGGYKSIDGALVFEEKIESETEVLLLCYPAGKDCAEYEVPKEVTAIYTNAFFRCNTLESVIIPEGVEYIESWSFGECERLESVWISGAVTGIGDEAFDRFNENFMIYGLAGSFAEEYAQQNQIPFQIGKALSSADITVTVNTTSCTYDGTEKTPEVTVKDGTETLKKGIDYTVSYKNNVKAGTAEVTVTGQGSYKGTLRKTFQINAGTVNAKTVTLSTTSYTYDGKAKTPAVTVKAGSRTLKKGTDYTVSYKNNVKAGTATVTVTGKGNYKGTVRKTFKIGARALNAKKVTLKTTSYTYSGKAKKPAVTVKDGSRTLKKGTDYTVSYKNNKKPGKATVTVKGKGNYKGTITKTFTIKPKTNKISSLKPGRKKAVLKWSKVSGVSGYEVYMKEGKSGKYKKVTTTSRTSYTRTKLKKGKTYYFKVKSYKKAGKKKIYSSYSRVKSVKIK